MLAKGLPRDRFIANLRDSAIDADAGVVTLVVGEVGRWSSQGRNMPDVHDLTYIDFHALSAEIVRTLRPDVVLSALLTDGFDAFQIVRVLESFGYRGRYRAVAPYLPNLNMIKSEIRTVAPNIDFDIVIMPPQLVSVI